MDSRNRNCNDNIQKKIENQISEVRNTQPDKSEWLCVATTLKCYG